MKNLKDNPKRIIVCEEKHGTYYYSAKTIKEVYKTVLYLVENRMWIYKQIYPKPEPLEFKAEDINSLPKNLILKASKDLKYYERNVGWYEESLEQLNMAQTALKNKDGKLGLKLLTFREDYQYEGFEFVYFQDVE